jgi:zinc transporter ZupT
MMEEAPEKASAWTVMICTLFMALVTGLGSIPFYFTDRLSKFWEGVSQSSAVGVMIAASYSLIQESEGFNNTWLVVGIFLGMVFIDRSQKFLHKYEDKMEFSGLKGMDAKKIVLFLGIMTLHAVGEGCGVGVSYAGPGGFPKGLLVTIAIGLHNIPEGLAVATVLASKKVPRRELTLWTITTAMPQPLLAVPAYVFVQFFSALFPFFAGFAAGCMIWISFAEIIPDALENISPTTLATSTTTSTFLFKAMQYVLEAAATEEDFFGQLRLLGAKALPLVLFLMIAAVCYQLFSSFYASKRLGRAGHQALLKLMDQNPDQNFAELSSSGWSPSKRKGKQEANV